jgi:hypothetical protein
MQAMQSVRGRGGPSPQDCHEPETQCIVPCGAGAGRGVLATSLISPGDAIMVSAPVAMVTAAQGTELGAERLLAALKDKQMSAADR